MEERRMMQKFNQPRKESFLCGHPSGLPQDSQHCQQCDLDDSKAVNSRSKEAVFLWKIVCSLSPSTDPPVTNEQHKIRQLM